MKDVINDPDKLWNYNMSQKKKNTSSGATTRSGFESTMTMNTNNNANLSRLTSRDFTDREETTLALPPLRLKRNTKATARKK